MIIPNYKDGKLIKELENIRVYKCDNELYLEQDLEGYGTELWAYTIELPYFKQLMKDYPKGDCLETGLGLGVSSRYILSFDKVKSLTTVEIDPNMIEVQRAVNHIDDNRHTIVNDNCYTFIRKTNRKFDFIFIDHYNNIYDKIYYLLTMLNNLKDKINPGGKIVHWNMVLPSPEEVLNRVVNEINKYNEVE